MPLEDVARGTVWNEYLDENLSTYFIPRCAALLRRAPATQRQNVLLEMARRRYAAYLRRCPRGGRPMICTLEAKWLPSPFEIINDILQENGW